MFPLSIITLACQIVIIEQVNNKFHFWPGYFNGEIAYELWCSIQVETDFILLIHFGQKL